MTRCSNARHIALRLRSLLFAVTASALLPFTTYADDLSAEVKSTAEAFLQQHVTFCGGDAYTMLIQKAPGDPVHAITVYRFHNFHWKATIVDPPAADKLNGLEQRFQLNMSADAYREYENIHGIDGYTSPQKGWWKWKNWNDDGGGDLSVQIDKRNGSWTYVRLNTWAENAIGDTAPTCEQVNIWVADPSVLP